MRRGGYFIEEIGKCHGRSFAIKHTFVLILAMLCASSVTLDELLN